MTLSYISIPFHLHMLPYFPLFCSAWPWDAWQGIYNGTAQSLRTLNVPLCFDVDTPKRTGRLRWVLRILLRLYIINMVTHALGRVGAAMTPNLPCRDVSDGPKRICMLVKATEVLRVKGFRVECAVVAVFRSVSGSNREHLHENWAHGGETGERDSECWLQHAPDEGIDDGVGFVGVGNAHKRYQMDDANDTDAKWRERERC